MPTTTEQLLIETLKFYANPDNWKRQKGESKYSWSKPPANLDCGAKARFVLETIGVKEVA